MSEETKSIRLSKAAKEFNIGVSTAVEFLKKKGHQIDDNPNTKIPEELYNLLAKNFQSERAVKENADKIQISTTVKNSAVLDASKEQKDETPEQAKDDDKETTTKNIGKKVEAKEEEKTPEPEPAKEPAKKAKTKAKAEPKTKAEPEPEQIATTADNKYRIVGFQMGKFYVVHGSFASETDCEKHIRIAGFDKYNPMIVKQSGNSHLRVCLGVFSTEAEAQEFIDRHQLKAWILKE